MVNNHKPVIGLVGPCAAGKTTLSALLRNHGFQVRHIAQEHSYVKNMWERISHPDILIYLDVSYSTTIKRRYLDWTLKEYEIQIDRLAHARQHADFYINTDRLSVEEVLESILEFVQHFPRS
jgi:deoxyadenosine/deoxycytidine kinase